MVRLPVVRTDRFYPRQNIGGPHFYERLSLPQDHRAAGRIMSMENSSDTIGNGTRDLPASTQIHQNILLKIQGSDFEI